MDLAPALALALALQVLAHATSFYSILSSFNFGSRIRVHLRSPYNTFLWFLLYSKISSAHNLPNSHVPTNGLAIINLPVAESRFYPGSNLTIALDVLGGRLSEKVAIPGSSLLTRLDALEIYLVSAREHVNITIATLNLPARKAGSTMRHINYAIPLCISSGPYNLTIHEHAYINDQASFSITSIPIFIDNTVKSPLNFSGNPALPSQVQLPLNLRKRALPIRGAVSQDDPLNHPTGHPISANPVTFTTTLLASGTDIPGPSKVMTSILVSTTTFTSRTTVSGNVKSLTVTDTATVTTTKVMPPTASPSPPFGGFVPVNHCPATRPGFALVFVCVIGIFLIL